MRRYVIALMIIAPLALSKLGHSQTQEQPTQTEEKRKGDVAAGKGLYTDNCQKCHGDKGQGVPRMFKVVSATIVHLGSKQAQEKSDDDVRNSMTKGFKKMEPITEPRPLTPEEIENILAFVRTLKQEPPQSQ